MRVLRRFTALAALGFCLSTLTFAQDRRGQISVGLADIDARLSALREARVAQRLADERLESDERAAALE